MARPSDEVPVKTQEKLIAEAVDYFEAGVSRNAINAVADQAAQYVGDKIWLQLTRDWRGRNCGGLARLARAALDGKDWLHGGIGNLAASFLELMDVPRIVRLFGKEVAKRIPLGVDQPLSAAARAMQVAGIVICVLNDRDLTRCECFIDVVVSEGKERLKQLMVAAVHDWKDLYKLA